MATIAHIIRSQVGALRVSRPSVKPLMDHPSSPDPVVVEEKSKSSKLEQNMELYNLPVQKQNVCGVTLKTHSLLMLL